MSLHHGLDQIRAADPPNFSVGGILYRSVVLTVWNFFTFVILALVITVPVAAVLWLVQRAEPVDLLFLIANLKIDAPIDQSLTSVAVAFVTLLAALVVQAAVAYRTFRSMAGFSVGFGDCLMRGIGAVLHLGEFLIVASIVVGAFAVLALWETAWFATVGDVRIAWVFSALIAGVLVYIVVGSWVIFPAIVIERIGPISAILRSWRLTSGRRWRILLLLVLLAAIEGAIVHFFPVQLVILGLQVPLSFFAAVVLTASYYNLVGEKDGARALTHIFA
jgi:hypothetical protein